MTSITLQLSEGRDRAPRAAAPLASAAATLWNWVARRISAPAQPYDPRKDISALWALANRYDSTQPSLAADLRGAAMRWERETEQP